MKNTRASAPSWFSSQTSIEAVRLPISSQPSSKIVRGRNEQ